MANGKASEDENVVHLRTDRRKALRKSILVLKVKGEGAKGVFFGYANILGKGGMFITTVNPMEEGAEFDISFNLPGAAKEIKCRCRVAWRRLYNPAELKLQPGMGIQFLDLSEDMATEIESFLSRLP